MNTTVNLIGFLRKKVSKTPFKPNW